MIRFYILPIVTVYDESVGADVRVAKYIYDLRVDRGMMDYGIIDAALAVAVVTQAQHEQIAAEIDVAAAPENIDQNISDIAIPKVQAIMEQLRIPAGWVDNTYTYRQVLRMIAGLFQFAKRHKGLHGEQLIDNQAQLDLRWNQIPQDRRIRIMATADDLGYDYSEVQNTWLIRQILKHLGDQWGERPFIMHGIEL